MTCILGFLSNRSGQFAVLSAVLSVPLLLAVGLAIDFTRYSSSSKHLQELTDIAALALAGSKEQKEEKLREMAMVAIEANIEPDRVMNVSITNLDATSDDIDLSLQGDIPVSFMALAGYDRLVSRTSALAQRAVTGRVEVSLVLDNTWSMSETDAKGISKIAALKAAANRLVDDLLTDESGLVKIALVPYADYVNVGTKNRKAPWIEVPDDYNKPAKDKVCVTLDTKQVCEKKAPKKTCTRVVDGVTETYQCGGGCTSYKTVKVAPYQSCTGGGSGTDYTWYGCVGSRRKNDNRLNDNNPSDRYPGFVDKKYRCPNPIVPLSSDKTSLQQAIDDMVINRGSYYKPQTYIPAGMIWGLNVLSPDGPLGEGAAYDDQNRKPRKVAILMTDGENTLKFNKNGKHGKISGAVLRVLNLVLSVNTDTETICDNMKAKKIEIFTIAFMVDDANAKSMLESCASDKEHYFDASDSGGLSAAFSGIGASLRVVRLAR